MREKTGCLVIGVDRAGETLPELDANLVLQRGDLLWLAGEKSYLSGFEKNLLN
ncbi:MAG: TrkA C-terminal domain-containing protein [Odoribacteraceae bacterium]|nr:TrkA C-terminal domain-containing protein [Odoribacteraceae bacterium]